MAAVDTAPSATGLHRAAQALDQFHAGQRENALALAQQQLADPACSRQICAEMHHIEAACYYQSNRLEDAEQAIRSAIAIDPSSATYLNTYGVILRKRERLEEAVRSYEDGNEASAKLCRCLLQLRQRSKRVGTQRASCGSIQALPGDQSGPCFGSPQCGQLSARSQILEEALEHYSRSDALEHHNPDMHCNWGLAWQLQERWDRAIDQFEVAISQKSRSCPVTYQSWQCLAVKERFEEACCALRRGVVLDDSCKDAKFNLGLTPAHHR